jgi:CRP/FNR family transcriptional regulator, anaerobic regulatory protein
MNLPEIFEFLRTASVSTAVLPKGTPVFTEGQGCGRIGFLLAGVVRVFKLSETGREITLYRIERGASCILSMSCALSHPIHQASAVVEEEAEIVMLTTGDFRELVRQSTQAREYVFTQFAERLTDLMLLIEEIVFRRMDERLASVLAAHAAKHRQRLEITHEALATELGTAREVVSRILKEFEREGFVQLGRGTIDILQPQAIERFSRA